MLTPWKKSYDKAKQHIQKQRHHSADKGASSPSCGFSSGHVRTWELDCEESWVPKNWCFWTVVLEKTHESPLDYKEIQPVHPKGNQPWIFIICTDCWSPSILPIWCEELTHWKRPWCCERLRAGEVGNRGRNGWMASWAQWTWIWANSGN